MNKINNKGAGMKQEVRRYVSEKMAVSNPGTNSVASGSAALGEIRRQGEILEEMDQLAKAVGVVGEEATALIERIKPVLGASQPKKEDISNSPPSATELGCCIHGLADRLVVVANMLHAATDRVEL